MADRTEEKTGKKRGRPSEKVRAVTVRVSARHLPIFTELGNGDVDAGVQAALELFCAGSHKFFEKAGEQRQEMAKMLDLLSRHIQLYESQRKDFIEDFGAFLQAASGQK
ncbi:MAG: hypothetical protein GY862_00205 [Gammaproteobacteria bacterium]|nr:hypothetical protein [Gammaproteobacteria bacterium]